MPPRGRAAADPEKKARDFEDFMNGEEYKHIKYVYEMRKNEEHELKAFETGTLDVVGEWQKILDSIFKLVEGFKVPGRRAKCKYLTFMLA